MSRTANALSDVLFDIVRTQARTVKAAQRSALLDVLISDDDMHESLEIRENVAREHEAHSH